MRLNHKRLAAASLARVGAFEKNEEETIEVALPEDLSTLSEDAVKTLRKNAIDAFNEVYQGGEVTLSTAQKTVLSQLKEIKLALDTELKTRKEANAANAAEAAELASAMVEEVEEETEVVEVTAEAAAEVVAEAEAVVAEAAPVVETAPKVFAPISVTRLKAKQTQALEIEPATPVSPIKAALGLPNVEGGAAMEVSQVADAFAQFTEAARPGPIQAAKRSNARFSQKHVIAHVERPFDPRAIVGKDNDATSAIEFAVDQARLPGGSLVAAGGWCAPSETVYDMCQMESTDGLVSVPEIQVSRGGLRYTQGLDWSQVFATGGFSFTEADDAAGSYSLTNEVQTLTEGGSGLTSYTLTYSGQTTASIDDDASAAQVQLALEALSNLAPGDVVVTGTTNPVEMVVTFGGTLAGVNVSTITSTPTGGSGTVVVAVRSQGGQAGPKPTDIVVCPEFIDTRLDVMGLAIQAGILINRAYPEAVQRYVSGALTAHAHRMAAAVIAELVAGSTPVTPTPLTNGTGVLAPLLSAIELQAEDIKYKHRMSRGTVLEAIFPFWARGAIRADLSRRQGVDMLTVTDAQITGWFRERGINPQFVYNWQNLGGVNALVWPTSVQFLLYPAGTWVKGAAPVITLSMLHDSTLNENNNFTALFTEEAWSVMKRCPESRVVTVALCPSGNTSAGSVITC